MMGIQDKNMKNSMKLKNHLKSKTLRKLETLTLTDWHIVIKPSEPCSGPKIYTDVYLSGPMSEKLSKS